MSAKKSRYLLILLFVISISVTMGLFPRSVFSATEGDFEWLIEPKFEHANDFYTGRAWVLEKWDGAWKQIDINGRAVIDNFLVSSILSYDKSTNLARFRDLEQRHGYIDLSGDIVIPAEYRLADTRFTDGVSVVRKDDLYGVIDTEGKIVLPIVYKSRIFIVNSNRFTVEKDGKKEQINAKGEVIEAGLADEKEKNSISDSNEKLIYASREGKVGFVDTEGNVVIDFQFKPSRIGICYVFFEGLASVLLDEPQSEQKAKDLSYGVINKKGELLFRLPGAPCGYFSEGFLLVQRWNDDTYGLVDHKGKWYALPMYAEVEHSFGHVSEGTLCVRTKEKTRQYEKGRYGYLKINSK